MAIELKFWDKVTGFKYPNGDPATPEKILKDFPHVASQDCKVVIEMLDEANGVLGAIDDLCVLKQVFEIDESLTDDEALIKIMEIRNAPPAPAPAGVMPEELRADVDYLLMLQEGV